MYFIYSGEKRLHENVEVNEEEKEPPVGKKKKKKVRK